MKGTHTLAIRVKGQIDYQSKGDKLSVICQDKRDILVIRVKGPIDYQSKGDQLTDISGKKGMDTDITGGYPTEWGGENVLVHLILSHTGEQIKVSGMLREAKWLSG